MKVLLTSIIVLLSSMAGAIEPDKEKHLGVSAVLGVTFYGALKAADDPNPALLAFSAVMVLGIMKESTDERFDWEDMGYNVLGAGIPILIIDF